MAQISEILLHAQACIATAEQVLLLFEVNPLTTEKLAAKAFFCRCIDHFRAALLLAQEDLDPEALVLVRGIVETTFVVGGLLTGSVTTAEMEAFDRAGRAKSAKAQNDFLRRNASSDLRERAREFAERNAGPILKFEQIAKQVDAEDLYNGHYRMFSHMAAHPSMTSVAKYIDYGEGSTSVRYPGIGYQQRTTLLIACGAFLHTCAAIEHWVGTTPSVNQSIQACLLMQESFGSVLDRSN
ncbi:hypothetical protein DW355_07775 [Hylemonella gracilis]|uniref:Uncharacterized protein n=1 Tax=Hylemonella gracilis TaxID=80880 RepID=A0A4P6UKN4_9BURK|nr:DUF5677 domain-containing protein [Hylemonella gracilis]QBK04685.1 hypothetical protein DW355_07775 [Hylemonella gracilis]